ncbi:MAG: hypothetical protein IPN29_18410 [Saprospiraceae bacterium]|nr:hypothetical protein [Saprospiraceae bacterium]
MKTLNESLNKIKAQTISLVEKYNFISNENLELKKEVEKLTAELEQFKNRPQFSSGFKGKEGEEMRLEIDQCVRELEECITLIGDE